MASATHTILESDTAGEATRKIFRDLLIALQTPTESTFVGRDPEALHDLRVATRRTRSALSQLSRAVSSDAVSHFIPEFKWLGDLTGECRDLDVWIPDLEARRRGLPADEAGALSFIESLVHEARDRAHSEVVSGLSSDRFLLLLNDWKISLSEETPHSTPSPDEDTAVKDFADRRIHKAYKRVRRISRDLGGEPQAEALHRLRIAAKKYRYLLEFFRGLFQHDQINDRIKELKNLQDVLGELNDREFQRVRLAAFANDLEATSQAGLLAFMRKLGSDIDRRQEELRRNVSGCLGPVVTRPPGRTPQSN